MAMVVFVPSFSLLVHLGDTLGAKACFGIWMSILYSSFPGIYVIIAAEILCAFGPDHYQANFGLYFTHYILYTLILMSVSYFNYSKESKSTFFFSLEVLATLASFYWLDVLLL